LPGLAALLVRLTCSPPGGTPVRVFSDRWWRASLEAPAGWQQVEFDDSKWSHARFRRYYGNGPAAVPPLIWDSVVRESLPGYPSVKLLTVQDNYRDRDSREGFPFLNAMPTDVTLPPDPTNDAEFLRYPRSSFLSEAGPKKTPVGAPPAP
jgi:hypothetical protein